MVRRWALHADKFTYMLIVEEIKEHLRMARLVQVKSRATWSGEPRCFLLERELAAEFRVVRNDQKDIDRWSKLEADMSHSSRAGTSIGI